jgi:hypothetical protein
LSIDVDPEKSGNVDLNDIYAFGGWIESLKFRNRRNSSPPR